MSHSALEVSPPSSLSPALLQASVPLADKNWFRTGGPARFFAEPATGQEFQEVLGYAAAQALPLFMLGEGANILISDSGYDGIVVRPQLKSITRLSYDTTHDIVEAQAGVRFADLITWCLENNLLGLEEFSGIPGTVGGAVFINIHYFQFLLSQFIVSAQVIEKGTGVLKTVDTAWFNFGYNYSILHDNNHYLISARFKLKKVTPGEAQYAEGRSTEIVRHRTNRYPASHTCGSFFRNFYEHEVSLMSLGKKLIYVAYYLDKIGIKGELTRGDATVSYQHANMIVNRGNATTDDIIGIARTMQKLVVQKFGILPMPECRLLGFNHYPLRT